MDALQPTDVLNIVRKDRQFCGTQQVRASGEDGTNRVPEVSREAAAARAWTWTPHSSCRCPQQTDSSVTKLGGTVRKHGTNGLAVRVEGNAGARKSPEQPFQHGTEPPLRHAEGISRRALAPVDEARRWCATTGASALRLILRRKQRGLHVERAGRQSSGGLLHSPMRRITV